MDDSLPEVTMGVELRPARGPEATITPVLGLDETFALVELRQYPAGVHFQIRSAGIESLEALADLLEVAAEGIRESLNGCPI